MFNSQFPILIREETDLGPFHSDENWDMSGANASPPGRSHQELSIDQIRRMDQIPGGAAGQKTVSSAVPNSVGTGVASHRRTMPSLST
jgi:hypothetical protein